MIARTLANILAGAYLAFLLAVLQWGMVGDERLTDVVFRAWGAL